MVRLSDLPPDIAAGLLALPVQENETAPWTPVPDLTQARVAIVTTAGLHRRSDARFVGGSAEYRLLPGDVDPADIVMSHVSINFDRSGFQQDVNVVFPVELLRSLAAAGEIGSVAQWHYSFMGATDPSRMEETGRQVATLLKEDGVTAAILVPV
ncbi:MAG: glycine/sarcosine/betaine reductase selenoprotein B family protein [Dehalococcoidia bacterium]